MSAFASEKRAKGICDRCGKTDKLKNLRSETQMGVSKNNRVCKNCWEPDHPQNFIGRVRVIDAMTLKDPRPDSYPGRSMWGWSPVGNPGVEVTCAVGNVRIIIEDNT